jgi:broad specificity phosphatase PhoE
MIQKLIIVRHGMRIDFEDKNWFKTAPRPYDPPLSKTGIKQVDETALYLKSFGIQYLFSSPFCRALQTADAIARELNLNFLVEYGFSEFMNARWFDQQPELMDKDEMEKAFPHIDWGYKSFATPKYPEHKHNDDVFKRTTRVFEKIDNMFNGTIAIVGHGAIIEALGRLLLGNSDPMDMGICSINMLVKTAETWTIEYASDEHLITRSGNFADQFN